MKAILLDLDGTIFDIAERDAFARYQALNDLGYHVTLDDEKKHYRLGKGTMEDHIQRRSRKLLSTSQRRVGAKRKHASAWLMQESNVLGFHVRDLGVP